MVPGNTIGSKGWGLRVDEHEAGYDIPEDGRIVGHVVAYMTANLDDVRLSSGLLDAPWEEMLPGLRERIEIPILHLMRSEIDRMMEAARERGSFDPEKQ